MDIKAINSKSVSEIKYHSSPFHYGWVTLFTRQNRSDHQTGSHQEQVDHILTYGLGLPVQCFLE